MMQASMQMEHIHRHDIKVGTKKRVMYDRSSQWPHTTQGSINLLVHKSSHVCVYTSLLRYLRAFDLCVQSHGPPASLLLLAATAACGMKDSQRCYLAVARQLDAAY